LAPEFYLQFYETVYFHLWCKGFAGDDFPLKAPLAKNLEICYITVMVRFSGKKLSVFLLTAYIALSVVGTFSFMMVEPLRSVKCEMENSVTDKILSIVDNYFSQHPAEEPAVATKAANTQFFPLRIGDQRVSLLLASPNTGIAFSKSPFRTSAKTPYINSKTTILLKLRI
jgi:hypothetical protein